MVIEVDAKLVARVVILIARFGSMVVVARMLLGYSWWLLW